jgi:uncharacterized delta-60 repeat protein
MFLKRLRSFLGHSISLSIAFGFCLAQGSPGDLDSSFDPAVGSNSNIFCLALQSDGKVLTGGPFTTVDGIGRNCIARLNADGSLDRSFDPGSGAQGSSHFISSSPRVDSLLVQPDGKVIVGGIFTSFAGVNRKAIVRLNADGGVDGNFVDPHLEGNTSNPGCFVSAIALQPDGKIIIGGWIFSFSGVARRDIARLNSNGTLDTNFSNALGLNGEAYAIVVQPDGKIVVGGLFTGVNGDFNRRVVARLNSDGSTDTNFFPHFPGGTGESIVLQPDGKILIGGFFQQVNGTGHTNIVRLKADGNIDDSFSARTDKGLYSIALQPDGKAVIGGWFTNVNDIILNRVARLNADGTVDAAYNPGGGADDHVTSLALQSDGKVLLSGTFANIDGVPRTFVARLHGDPVLSIEHLGTDIVMCWPTNAPGYILQSAGTLGPFADWTDLPGGDSPILGAQYRSTNALFDSPRFFRLRK